MTTKPLICLLLAISFSFSISEELIASVYYLRTSGKFKVVYGDKLDPDAVATATYKTEYEKEGWDYLSLQSYQGDDNKYQDHIKSYGMGFLEGVMTHQRIYPFYLNMKHFHFHDPNATVQTFEMPEITKKFVQQNLVYMKQKALANKAQDPYWDQVYNFYKQMMGLIDGYNSMAEKGNLFVLNEPKGLIEPIKLSKYAANAFFIRRTKSFENPLDPTKPLKKVCWNLASEATPKANENYYDLSNYLIPVKIGEKIDNKKDYYIKAKMPATEKLA